MKVHENACPKKLTKCPYSSAGCAFEVSVFDSFHENLKNIRKIDQYCFQLNILQSKGSKF